MVRLDDACRELGVPLLLARSYGLVGYIRASLPEHCVVESKPDNSVEDLRLHRPWPALAEYAASFDLAAVDDVTHRHIPWGARVVPCAQAHAALAVSQWGWCNAGASASLCAFHARALCVIGHAGLRGCPPCCLGQAAPPGLQQANTYTDTCTLG